MPPAIELLTWYDRHRRSLPWRALAGTRPDPYRVWLSEIMLQQTTVAAIIPRFAQFLERFPTLDALAAAPAEAVMAEWSGLGYYARARNLHACAKAVAALGGFPGTVAELRALPGIGVYTAAAIAAIGFGVAVVPVDGNVERVAARVFAFEAPLPGGRAALARLAATLGEDADARARPSDFAQALFDLGATICTARAPACAICPWQGGCAARQRNLVGELPRQAAKAPRPTRHGVHFWAEDAAGRVLLHRRPPTGLLGGTLALPGTPWREAPFEEAEALAEAPQPGPWQRAGLARHSFTHFHLEAEVYALRVPALAGGELHPAGIAELPTVFARMARIARAALAVPGSGQASEDPS